MYYVKVLRSAVYYPVKYSSGLPVGFEFSSLSTTTLLQVALFSQSFFGEGIALYIVVFERLKNAIIERIYDFYTTGFDEDGDIVDPDYETKVLSRNSSPVYASLDWLLENNAISSHDIDLFDQIKKLRNSIAHEIDKMMIDGLPTELPESFNDMANLLDKIENWWIVNVEIPTDPDFARGDIEKDEDRIIPGSIASLKMMVDIALGTDEEAEYYINEFRRLGLLGPNPGSS